MDTMAGLPGDPAEATSRDVTGVLGQSEDLAREVSLLTSLSEADRESIISSTRRLVLEALSQSRAPVKLALDPFAGSLN